MNQHPNHPPEIRTDAMTWRSRIIQTFVLLAFGALFLVPLLTYGCRGEIERWKIANAILKFEGAEDQTVRDAALKVMEAAVARIPEDAQQTSGLAQRLAASGRAQDGLNLCDTWLARDSDSNHEIAEVLGAKSICLQALGQWPEALATLKQTPREVLSSSDMNHGNNLSYFRALADTELDAAKADMDRVLEQLSQPGEWPLNRPLPFQAKTVIAATIVLRALGERETLIPELDEIIEQYEQSAHRSDSRMIDLVYNGATFGFPFTPDVEKAVSRRERHEIERLTDALAVLLTLRGLIYRDTGDDSAMTRDRIRVAELGNDSQRLADSQPDTVMCLNTLLDASIYLDTRGFVLFKKKQPGAALRDLNLAILAAETVVKAIDSPLLNSVTLSTRIAATDEDRERFRNVQTHNLSVLYYHRMMLYRSHGANSNADADVQRIEELGFDAAVPRF